MTSAQHRLKTITITGLFALLTTGLLSSCGGGLENTLPTGRYEGVMSQAALTSANDDAFGTAMMEGGAASGDARNQMDNAPYPLQLASADASSQATQKNNLTALETMLENIVTNTPQQWGGSSASASVGPYAYDDPVRGDCGGNITTSFSDTGGTISFNSYCVEYTVVDTTITMTINGTVSISVTGDIQNGTFDEIIMSYSGMTITVDDGSQKTTHYYSGTITLSSNGTITYTTDFQREGRIFRIENPKITGSDPNIEISGKLYHPDYGYVMITTDAGDTFKKVGDQYCGGTLIITGKDGVTSTMQVADDCKSYIMTYADGAPEEPVQWQ